MLFDEPHRRWNPLLEEWLLVSPQRNQRPWSGRLERMPENKLPAYDEGCYLCPGNRRSDGALNPFYTGAYAFDNDFPALEKETQAEDFNKADLLIARSEAGVCRVICYSPRHDLSLALLPIDDIRQVVRSWQAQWRELSRRPDIGYVQIFENRGEMMGASNPHPHGQIWATGSVPHLLQREDAGQRRYYHKHRSCLLCDTLKVELHEKSRIVLENDEFVAFVPFWALWPFETLLISRNHYQNLSQLGESEISGLADIIRRLNTRYDNLFKIPFPFSMGFHQQPPKTRGSEAWHLHAHYFPPLLRGPQIRKFMVGYELLAEPQRDISPEAAAEILRTLPDRHYIYNNDYQNR